jgi:hypothetical protein
LFWGMEGMEFQCSTHFYLLEWCQITFLPHVKISHDGIHSRWNREWGWPMVNERPAEVQQKPQCHNRYWRWRKNKLKIRSDQMYIWPLSFYLVCH